MLWEAWLLGIGRLADMLVWSLEWGTRRLAVVQKHGFVTGWLCEVWAIIDWLIFRACVWSVITNWWWLLVHDLGLWPKNSLFLHMKNTYFNFKFPLLVFHQPSLQERTYMDLYLWKPDFWLVLPFKRFKHQLLWWKTSTSCQLFAIIEKSWIEDIWVILTKSIREVGRVIKVQGMSCVFTSGNPIPATSLALLFCHLPNTGCAPGSHGFSEGSGPRWGEIVWEVLSQIKEPLKSLNQSSNMIKLAF